MEMDECYVRLGRLCSVWDIIRCDCDLAGMIRIGNSTYTMVKFYCESMVIV